MCSTAHVSEFAKPTLHNLAITGVATWLEVQATYVYFVIAKIPGTEEPCQQDHKQYYVHCVNYS